MMQKNKKKKQLWFQSVGRTTRPVVNAKFTVSDGVDKGMLSMDVMKKKPWEPTPIREMDMMTGFRNQAPALISRSSLRAALDAAKEIGANVSSTAWLNGDISFTINHDHLSFITVGYYSENQ